MGSKKRGYLCQSFSAQSGDFCFLSPDFLARSFHFETDAMASRERNREADNEDRKNTPDKCELVYRAGTCIVKEEWLKIGAIDALWNMLLRMSN
jgi:hypothetical protein